MMNISKREKLLLKILGIILGLFLIWTFIAEPLIRMQDKSENTLVSNKSKMRELDKLITKYQKLKAQKRRYMSQLRNNKGVLSHAEDIAKKLGYKPYTSERNGKVKTKYTKYTTNVKFESIGMTSLLKFIHSIENSNKVLRISNIHIRLALKGRDTYDVRMTIESLAK